MLKNLKKKKNNKGFTLVELLVVIAIIGILAVVAVPSLFKQIDKAKATQVVTNVKALKTEILTEYANANTDTELIKADGPFAKAKITSLLELKADHTGKLGEEYSVVDDGDVNNSKVIIRINCKDASKADAVKKILEGSDFAAEDSGKSTTILDYSVGAK